MTPLISRTASNFLPIFALLRRDLLTLARKRRAFLAVVLGNVLLSLVLYFAWDWYYFNPEYEPDIGDVVDSSVYYATFIFYIGIALFLAAWSGATMPVELHSDTAEQLVLSQIRPWHLIVAKHLTAQSVVLLAVCVFGTQLSSTLFEASKSDTTILENMAIGVLAAFAVTSAGLFSSCLSKSFAAAVIFSILLAACIMGLPFVVAREICAGQLQVPFVVSFIDVWGPYISPFVWLAAEPPRLLFRPPLIPPGVILATVLSVAGIGFSLGAVFLLKRLWRPERAVAPAVEKAGQFFSRQPPCYVYKDVFPDKANPVAVLESRFGVRLRGQLGRRAAVWTALVGLTGWTVVGWTLTLDQDTSASLVGTCISVARISIALAIPIIFAASLSSERFQILLDGLAMTGLPPRALINGKFYPIIIFTVVCTSVFALSAFALVPWAPRFILDEPITPLRLLSWIARIPPAFLSAGLVSGAISVLISYLARSQASSVLLSLAVVIALRITIAGILEWMVVGVLPFKYARNAEYAVWLPIASDLLISAVVVLASLALATAVVSRQMGLRSSRTELRPAVQTIEMKLVSPRKKKFSWGRASILTGFVLLVGAFAVRAYVARKEFNRAQNRIAALGVPSPDRVDEIRPIVAAKLASELAQMPANSPLKVMYQNAGVVPLTKLDSPLPESIEASVNATIAANQSVLEALRDTADIKIEDKRSIWSDRNALNNRDPLVWLVISEADTACRKRDKVEALKSLNDYALFTAGLPPIYSASPWDNRQTYLELTAAMAFSVMNSVSLDPVDLEAVENALHAVQARDRILNSVGEIGFFIERRLNEELGVSIRARLYATQIHVCLLDDLADLLSPYKTTHQIDVNEVRKKKNAYIQGDGRIRMTFKECFPEVQLELSAKFDQLYVAAKEQTRLNLAMLAIAVLHYRYVNGEFPLDVNSLLPTYLVRVPYDEYGAPLSFVAHPDGFAVYAGKPPESAPDREGVDWFYVSVPPKK
jgi:hypothetical protein